MKKHNRYLQFENIEPGQPVSSECSLCKRTFRVIPEPKERTDDVLLRMRAEFDAHDCKAAQAAVEQ